jgi:glutaminyl-tRNA synthetase
MEPKMNSAASELPEAGNFIHDIINADLQSGKHSLIHTRFPPEPNGYLHIGHAKSICLNFGIAAKYKGICNLRFDDTNPAKEDVEYVESIREDVKWLGFDWGTHEYFASDYYDLLYDYAIQLIKSGKAYVCDLSGDQTRAYRGTLTEPGQNSPFRDRSVAENLDLFARMTQGEFEEGSCILRAKIDMAHPNINMRDPAIYRIKKVSHDRTGDKWCVYPMYDFAHGYSDHAEGITHSICTLEFEAHRPLYDWFLEAVGLTNRPRQIEFARLNLNYTVMSKRKLLELVEQKLVHGWDDPRMPTISGLRRRGFTPSSIREFCDRIGVAKTDSTVDIALLHFCIREELNKTAKRAMVVLNPLKLLITNYPESQVEDLETSNNPEDESMGKRLIPFCRELYIEQEDFMEEAPKKFFRLSVGSEVRLMNAYYVTCTGVVKNEKGEITEVHCTYDPATRGGWSQDARKVKGTLHWVSARHARNAEVRLYDHLFKSENPSDLPEGLSYQDDLNPESLQICQNAKIEPGLVDCNPSDRFQFLRNGYFCPDKNFTTDLPVFNRVVGLRDTWAKVQKNG